MTQYLLTVFEPTGGVLEPEALAVIMKDVGEVDQEMRDAGVWVFAGGLQPGDLATVVDATGAEPVVTDGPYLETKEWIGGFWVFELPDLDAALQWATEASQACAGKVEVRPFQDEPA